MFPLVDVVVPVEVPEVEVASVVPGVLVVLVVVPEFPSVVVVVPELSSVVVVVPV